MISKANAEHYAWGRDCDAWTLVKAESFTVIQESMPAHASETRHRHLRSRQFFYVLGGEAMIEVDGTRGTLTAGEGMEIPPGAAHQVFNNSGQELSFLVMSCPPSHGDRIET